MTRSRYTNAEVIEAYRQTGSVWEAGKLLGLAGQSVWERLRNIDFPLATRKWTDAEVAELRTLAETCPIGEIARRLGRPYMGIALKMSELEIRSSTPRRRKIPRGAGFDKATVVKHMRALEAYDGPITRYCRAHSLTIDLLVAAIQKYDLAWWDRYAELHTNFERRECEYCRRPFYPSSGKQRTCSRKCQQDRRVDRNYFGGNRRNTIGLAEGICQLCGRSDAKSLSSHHIIGKENDPENEHLIALCSGCHQLVTIAATRNFVNSESAWQSLITLVYLRKFGHLEGRALYVEVALEIQDEDDE